MASFVEDLWNSVFTPGPTPTLLVATNVTFAALQSVLFILLLATYSIHFIVLSFLSGALWWSINWFAREVREAQAAQASMENQAENVRGAIDSADSETETETAQPPPDIKAPAASTSLLTPSGSATVRQRPSAGGDSSEHGGTDSEWEKVEDKP
ncbi:hypothetical protein ASPZODRAFT_1827036 [Penicilliopsis zonata CBS 506.65]|uniref:Uncharacterized protein n=1 Tax=Penicilliopsis zonata CBS 506.65 TaxID=1073090 RepID=A0A1L9SLC1_9EURO|nr:hypothetical protein ASPZODRAFT_1827036 [Penicilliopsis zonata CBS 506.65]OJJ47995.1 hypothetical protein ASPZODRAFT_1827036 [Penicilliopsis zonata CBS 506.65]